MHGSGVLPHPRGDTPALESPSIGRPRGQRTYVDIMIESDVQRVERDRVRSGVVEWVKAGPVLDASRFVFPAGIR